MLEILQVERVEVKDIRLPQQVRRKAPTELWNFCARQIQTLALFQLTRAMAAEAEAAREARAKVVAAEGEQKVRYIGLQ